MRSITWGSVEAASDGGYDRIEPGAYVGVIQQMEDVADKEYVRLVFDIAEGPRKGFFADEFYKSKPWAHNLILSYKDKALPMLKGRLETIQACNPGFDPFAAWDAGRLDMFNGRKVGVVLRTEEYFDKKTEEFKMGSAKCFRLCTLEDVKSGKLADPKPKTLSDDDKMKALTNAGYGQLEADQIVARISRAADAERAHTESASADYSDVPFL